MLTSAYDAAGRRTSFDAAIAGTADFANTYQYDALGRTTQITQTDGDPGSGESVSDKRIDLTYTDRGQFDTITRYADLAGISLVAESAWTYDADGRLTSLNHSSTPGGSGDLAFYTWTWDSAGRLTDSASVDGTVTYTYDATGQLTAADYDYQSDESWTYDANGNRTGGGYTTGTNNKTLSDGTYNYEYDAEGNRTKRTEIVTGDDVEYAWNHANLLTRVTFRDSSGAVTKQVNYTYDAQGRRISKAVDPDGDGVDNVSTHYVYDGPGGFGWLDNVVFTFEDPDAAGSLPPSLQSRNLYGPAVDQLFASEDALGEVLWPLADHLGTIRDWASYDDTSQQTTIHNHLTYDAFGNITGQTNASHAVTHAFTGREWDADIELYYYRARWYDPSLGSFISEDPLGFLAGDANVNRYVGNGPTYSYDPSGLKVIFKPKDPKSDADKEAAIKAEKLWLKAVEKATTISGKLGDKFKAIASGDSTEVTMSISASQLDYAVVGDYKTGTIDMADVNRIKETMRGLNPMTLVAHEVVEQWLNDHYGLEKTLLNYRKMHKKVMHEYHAPLNGLVFDEETDSPKSVTGIIKTAYAYKDANGKLMVTTTIIYNINTGVVFGASER